jgi:hypothetical protein
MEIKTPEREDTQEAIRNYAFLVERKLIRTSGK